MTDETRLTQFLLALADRMPDDRIPESAGKSLETILSEEAYCDVTDIRCVCGVSVPCTDEVLVTCTVCEKQLHRACVEMSADGDASQFVCPICRFRVPQSGQIFDPLRGFWIWLKEAEDSVQSVGALYERLNQISEQFRYAQMEAARGESGGIPKGDSGRKAPCTDSVIDAYNRLLELREKWEVIIPSPDTEHG